MLDWLTIDTDKCLGEGQCVAECPARLLEMGSADTIPRVKGATAGACLGCGHCVAVCPTGAISHQLMTPEQCPPIRTAWVIGPEQAEQLLRARRSVRVFKDEPVDRALLARAIEMARYAPTAHNRQDVAWTVIERREDVHRLAELTIDYLRTVAKQQPAGDFQLTARLMVVGWRMGRECICWNAPHVVIAHAAADNKTGLTDCSIALTYLSLAAPTLGLGACWLGLVMAAAANQEQPWQEFLALPEGRVMRGAMAIGYPQHQYTRLPARNAPQISWR